MADQSSPSPTANKANPVPYAHASPYLSVNGASEALDFYRAAFGAEVTMRIEGPNGAIGHAEIRIGDAVIMLSEEWPPMNFRSPQTLGGTCVVIHLYVRDVDAFAKRAEDAGATLLKPVTDEFYGDRSVKLRDPFGHVWNFATHREDVSAAEIQRRASAMHG